MAKLPNNIDKARLRKGYVGYGNGAWTITRSGKRWQARKGADYLFGDTLEDVSRQLYEHSARGIASRLCNPFMS